jgi:hypothetical protein
MKKLIIIIVLAAAAYYAAEKLGLLGGSADRTTAPSDQQPAPPSSQVHSQSGGGTGGYTDVTGTLAPSGAVDQVMEYGTGYTQMKVKKRSRQKLDNMNDEYQQRLAEELE